MKTVHEKSFEIIFFVPVHPTISVDDDELKLPNCDRAAKSEFSTFFFLLRSAPFFGENWASDHSENSNSALLA